MPQISLTKGAFTLVDAADYDRLIQMGNWCLSNVGYAVLYRTTATKREVLNMHRLVMNAPRHLTVDHINRNRLDNRRENLRFATRTEQQANTGIRSDNSSTFKGVGFAHGKYEARIRYQSRRLFLGRYDDPVRAALVRDAVAAYLYRDFAQLNFPNQLITPEVETIMLELLAKYHLLEHP